MSKCLSTYLTPNSDTIDHLVYDYLQKLYFSLEKNFFAKIFLYVEKIIFF